MNIDCAAGLKGAPKPFLDRRFRAYNDSFKTYNGGAFQANFLMSN